MTRIELLQRTLYAIAKYDHETRNYVDLNKSLWDNIKGLDQEAIEEAIVKLTEANL